MGKPNMIYQNSARKFLLVKEEILTTYNEAVSLQSELKLSGLFHMVKVTRFKMGSRPHRHNNFTPTPYHYAVRAYNKQIEQSK